MKGQISRISHTTGRDYSGLYHVQGGMITDADLSEQATIARDRTDALGNDAIRDGVPAIGGLVRLQAKGTHPDIQHIPFLRPGVVYADGLRGAVRATKEIEWGEAEALSLLSLQAGLPDAPKRPESGEHIVYVDLWHRPVFALEDPRLLEVGLHGAETSFRTQVMAQIKTAPLKAAAQIESGTGAFPAQGNGVMQVGALSDSDTGNPCDPCAPVIELAARLGNALFRVEVVDVAGPANAPDKIALAWSVENAAMIAPRSAPPDGFQAPGHVYEHFDRTTEMHKGVFADPSSRARAEFRETVATVHPRDAVRRWDGYAVFNLGTGNVETHLGRNGSAFDGAIAKLTLDHFSLSLEVKDKSFVAGDFWLVEIREHAEKTDTDDKRIHLVSPTPMGIRHHYTCLFRINGDTPQPLTQDERRKLSFPALSDIPASHVSFKNNCEKLYGPQDDGAQTVQQALDRLCKIDAGDIALDVDCARFANAKTVQDGFKALCTIDADTIAFDNTCTETFGNAKTVGDALDALCGISSDRSWMRYVLDWGVLCGLQAQYIAKAQTVRVSPGALLTETGRFQVTSWTIPVDFKLDAIRSLVRTKANARMIDVAFGLIVGEDGTLEPMVTQYTGTDTFIDKLDTCEKSREGFAFDKLVAELPQAQKATTAKVIGVAASGAWEKGARLSQQELDEIEGFVGKAARAYGESRSPEEVEVLQGKLDAVRAEYTLNAAGEVLDFQRGARAANLAAVLIRNSQAFVDACKCAALWPHCPTGTNNFVPLALLTGTFRPAENGVDPDKLVTIHAVCMLERRRQALTPRTMAYHFREMFEQVLVNQFTGQRPKIGLEALADACCPRDPDGADNTGRKKGLFGYLKPEIAEGTLMEKVAGKYIDLDNLTLEAAEYALTGNGVEITEILDLDKAADVDKLGALTLQGGLDRRLSLKEKLSPGDKAVLIAKDGQAAGYLVQERGLGKYVYKPSTEKTAPRDKTLSAGFTQVEIAADALEKKMSELEGATSSTDKRIEALAGSFGALESRISGSEAQVKQAQDAVQASVGAVRDEIAALDETLIAREARVEEFRARVTALGASTSGQLDVVAERMTTLESRANAIGDTASEKIATADQELARLNGAIEAASTSLEKINGEITTLQKEREGLIATLRAERPIEALGDSFAENKEAFARQKIFTVGDLVKADDTVLRKLNTVGNLTVMRQQKKQARTFLGS